MKKTWQKAWCDACGSTVTYYWERPRELSLPNVRYCGDCGATIEGPSEMAKYMAERVGRK